MVGDQEKESCSGSVYSWWCSNRDRLCSAPTVASFTSSAASLLTSDDMSECDRCAVKFSILRRKRVCNECGLLFCSSCAKRGTGGVRQCHKCLILTQWPIDLAQVSALRSRDLRHFLHSHRISTNTCTEKPELVQLVIGYLKCQQSANNPARSFPTYSRPSPSTVTRDDGIRVRPTSFIPNDSALPSQRSFSLSREHSIRVFPTNAQANDEENDTHGGSHNEETEILTSRPSENTRNVQETEEPASEETLTSPSENHAGEAGSHPPYNLSQTLNASFHLSLADLTNPNDAQHSDLSPDSVSMINVPTDASIDENIETRNETSTTTPPPNVPTKTSNQVNPKNVIKLEDLKNEEAIKQLTIRQCKEILSLHRVNIIGVKEKYELTDKVTILWKDYTVNDSSVDDLPDDLVCKICMDHAIDCVLLECGHMVSCTPCGKQMSECPVCRQYVVRVVRTFRA